MEKIKSIFSKIKQLIKCAYDYIQYTAPLIIGIIAMTLSTISQLKEMFN